MENITLADLGVLVAFLVSLVGGIAYLKKHLKDWIQSAVRDDFERLDDKVNQIQSDISDIRDDMGRDKADNARYRILRFNDEILQKKHHSLEHFNQILGLIADYEAYSKRHPDTYPNGQATAAIANIKRVYQSCFENDSFLR